MSVGDVVVGLAIWEAFKGVWRNFWAFGCAGIALVILLGGFILSVACAILVFVGWGSTYKSMAKRPSLGHGLLIVSAIASVLCFISGFIILAAEGPPPETSSAGMPWGGIMVTGAMGYLYFGGLILGICFLVKRNQEKRHRTGGESGRT